MHQRHHHPTRCFLSWHLLASYVVRHAPIPAARILPHRDTSSDRLAAASARVLVRVVSASARKTVAVTPSAERLTTSLRDIGYDFNSAVADILDNSVSAGARQVDIDLVFAGRDSYILITDDGSGMTEAQLTEAMRFGTRRGYDGVELGKYGLGLKTASLSQCRRLTVVTRTAPVRCHARIRSLDLDHVAATDRWEVLTGPPTDGVAWAGHVAELISRGPGTVVIWDQLDRVFPASGSSSGWARRRLDALTMGLHQHLGMVFHRFIEGTAVSRQFEPLVITINGEKVKPWNPFAPDESETVEMPARHFEFAHSGTRSDLVFRPFVLPARSLFSSAEAFDRMSGPHKWNRQQGLYIYRADRLVQSGGWAGIRAIDEHTKLARASLDFSPNLDELFRINVAKMRVILPAEVRTMLESEIGVLCKRAEAMYRRDQRTASGSELLDEEAPLEEPAHSNGSSSLELSRISSALLSAAMATGTSPAFLQIVDYLRTEQPDVVRQLGW